MAGWQNAGLLDTGEGTGSGLGDSDVQAEKERVRQLFDQTPADPKDEPVVLLHVIKELIQNVLKIKQYEERFFFCDQIGIEQKVRQS